MLVVKLEVWPGGDEKAAEEIGRMHVCNVSRLAPISNYEVEVLDEPRVRGVVTGYRRDDGPWELVRRAIQVAQNNSIVALLGVNRDGGERG